MLKNRQARGNFGNVMVHKRKGYRHKAHKEENTSEDSGMRESVLCLGGDISSESSSKRGRYGGGRDWSNERRLKSVAESEAARQKSLCSDNYIPPKEKERRHRKGQRERDITVSEVTQTEGKEKDKETEGGGLY